MKIDAMLTGDIVLIELTVMVRKVLFLIVGILCWEFGCAPVFLQEGQKRRGSELGLVRTFVYGVGRQSEHRLLRLWTANGSLEVKGLGVMARGRKEIKDFLGYARTVDVRLSMSEPAVEGDTIFCRLEETNNWLHLVGVEPMIYKATFVIDEGKIDKLVVEPDQTVVILLTGRGVAFWQWLKKEEPEAVDELLPDGRFRFTPENGRRLMDLIARWRGIN
ncbi:MAG: hypothetical protein WHU95_03785 [candidate division WOR-3 bacterium]|jgi:hypothetical protein|nr:hypothetical protein [candidate division WOR-3 bacterium]MDH7518801.1 hypothetical protein [bacterium]